jgi:branched-chain amino acid aminotransferase
LEIPRFGGIQPFEKRLDLAMEQCLLNYFVLNDELKNSCDFNPGILKNGKGIYELFRVIDGTPLFLKEHINRYYKSLELGGYTPNHSRNQLINRLKILIESNRLKQGNIQFEYLQSEDKNVFLAWITTAIYPTDDKYVNGVEMLSLNAIRELPHLKSLNLPAREKANKVIANEGVFEVLLVGDDGIITEGSRSNIFFVKNDQLYTTPLSLILDGITRSEVISVAKKEGVVVNEELIAFESVKRFEAAFLTSTSMKVLPVRKIDEIQFSTKNQIVNRLKMLYNLRITMNLANFNWNEL